MNVRVETECFLTTCVNEGNALLVRGDVRPVRSLV
jgi:hypothetical protein